MANGCMQRVAYTAFCDNYYNVGVRQGVILDPILFIIGTDYGSLYDAERGVDVS